MTSHTVVELCAPSPAPCSWLPVRFLTSKVRRVEKRELPCLFCSVERRAPGTEGRDTIGPCRPFFLSPSRSPVFLDGNSARCSA